jgi:hypothetical protein
MRARAILPAAVLLIAGACLHVNVLSSTAGANAARTTGGR